MSDLVRALEGQRLLAEMNTDFERLSSDPQACERYDSELREWDAVLLDGLEHEPTQAR